MIKYPSIYEIIGPWSNEETTQCVIEKIHTESYETNKGYINKNYCFCNAATAKVGDEIKVKKRFLQNF